jgi:endo-1,4-beta-xylanase
MQRHTRMIPRPLAVLLALAALTSLRAQTPVPPGDDLLGGQGMNAFGLQLMPRAFDAVSVRLVTAEGATGFGEALRVESTRDTGQSFAIQLRGLSRRPIAEGDVGLVRFFARTIESSDESGAGRVGVSVRGAAGFGMGFADETFSPARDWTEFLVPFRAMRDYGPFEAVLVFSLGGRKQTVEIGGVDFLHHGKKLALADLPRTRFTYAGREPGAAWREAALERIERIRKGDITVRVVDSAGRPVPGANVRLEQTRSGFEFGTALPFRRLVEDTPDNLIFREKLLELFNAASNENDLKWPQWIDERENSVYSRAQAMAGLRWLREHGLPARGHVLVWPGWNNLPDIVRDLRGTPRQDEIPELVLDHIREIGAVTRDWLVEFDVLNEPFTNHDLMDLFGPQIMVDWFKVARETMPDVVLYLNDFSNHDATTDAAHVEHFANTARYLLENGAPLDALGLQAHIGGRPNDPENVLATLDRYWNEFKLPVRITEFDIRTTDEELQADYTRDFLILAFSHPSVIGIQHWGFWERSHWIPIAAMYRGDWSEKPNAAAYKSLVLDQWRTRFEEQTAANGTLNTRGFLGEYRVTVDSDGRHAEQTFKLAAGEPATVEVKLR